MKNALCSICFVLAGLLSACSADYLYERSITVKNADTMLIAIQYCTNPSASRLSTLKLGPGEAFKETSFSQHNPSGLRIGQRPDEIVLEPMYLSESSQKDYRLCKASDHYEVIGKLKQCPESFAEIYEICTATETYDDLNSNTPESSHL